MRNEANKPASGFSVADNPLKKMDDFVHAGREYFKTPKVRRDKTLSEQFSLNRIREKLVSAKSELSAYSYSLEATGQWKMMISSISKLLFVCAEEDIKETAVLLEKYRLSSNINETSMIPDLEAKITLAKGSLNKASETIIDRYIDDLKKSDSINYRTVSNIILNADDCYIKGYLEYAPIEKKKTLLNLAKKEILAMRRIGYPISKIMFIDSWEVEL